MIRNCFSAHLLAPLGFALGLFATTAQAIQNIDVRDSDTTIARVSLRDQTRIRILDGHVTDVYGDVYDAAANPGGRLSVTKDETDGELYVKPTPPSPSMTGGPMTASTAPIKVDIKSDRGTFALLLQPTDSIGDTIVAHVIGGSVKPSPAAAAGFMDKATSHERAIKALTLAMASPQLADAAPGREIPGGPQEVALWKEARFVLTRTHEVSGLVGEVYDLTNISTQRMVIDERELFHRGVLSVAARRLVLEPGETTPVWIVRQANASGK